MPYVKCEGASIYYEIHGEGPPLVLLHWFLGSSRSWEPFIADFAKHFQLIIPDLRGHGRSTNPSNQFTHRQAALDIFALLDQLEIGQFRAVGICTGGATLLHMATQQPANLKAMVLVSTAHYITEQERAWERQLAVDSEDWDWDSLRQRHVHGDDQIRALLNQLREFKDSYDDVNFTPPYLSTITARTLIVHGDRDGFYPVSIPFEMYAAIPNAYLWIVPNGDHIPILDERTELFTQTTLEFLRGDWGTG